MFYTTYYSSNSKDKTDISIQFNSTKNLMKDFNKFRKKIHLYNAINQNINSFHKNSIRTLVHKRFIDNNYYPNEEREKDGNLTLPNFNNNYNTINNNTNRKKNKISLSKSPFNKTISNNSFITLPSFNFSKSRNKNNELAKLSDYKFEKTVKFIQKSFEHERKGKISNKTKEIFLLKYFKKIQEKELLNLNYNLNTKNELFDVEINSLEKKLNLLKSFINEENKYLEDLKIKYKKEKEYNQVLINKKMDSFKETFLLRFRLNKIERKFSKYLNNKFFLLCVKNLTNQLENFEEEDKKDYLLDLDSLEKISDFSYLENQFEILKEEDYSEEEIEKVVFGRKLFKEQKNIFSSTEEFNLKLNQIESKIQSNLIVFNQQEKDLNKIRNEYYEKLDLIENDIQVNNFFENEIEKNLNKLKEVKFRNNYLQNYLKNIKDKIEKNSSEKNECKIVENKIYEIFKEINERHKIKIKLKFNEKITILTYLKYIENILNKLIKKINEYKNKNNEIYLFIVNKFDKIKRLKTFELFKEKMEKENEKEMEKIIDKSKKLIIKPFKKVQPKYNIKLNKQNLNKTK
jgi:hypothetical protein